MEEALSSRRGASSWNRKSIESLFLSKSRDLRLRHIETESRDANYNLGWRKHRTMIDYNTVNNLVNHLVTIFRLFLSRSD